MRDELWAAADRVLEDLKADYPREWIDLANVEQLARGVLAERRAAVPEVVTTEIALARAVLRGDHGATRGLIDRLMEAERAAAPCEHPDCDGQRPGTLRVYSRNRDRVMWCCEAHANGVVDEGGPEYTHSCENCDCLLPIN